MSEPAFIGLRFNAQGEFNEGLEQMLYRRDEDVCLLQDQLETLLVDFNLLKGTFEYFTEDHWHPFQRCFFQSHPCTRWMVLEPLYSSAPNVLLSVF